MTKRNGMFTTKVLPDGESAKIKVSFPEWSITIEGDADFITPIFQEICETHEFKNALASALRETTKDEVIAEMRRGGWPKELIKDFKNGEFWPNLLG